MRIYIKWRLGRRTAWISTRRIGLFGLCAFLCVSIVSCLFTPDKPTSDYTQNYKPAGEKELERNRLRARGLNLSLPPGWIATAPGPKDPETIVLQVEKRDNSTQKGVYETIDVEALDIHRKQVEFLFTKVYPNSNNHSQTFTFHSPRTTKEVVHQQKKREEDAQAEGDPLKVVYSREEENAQKLHLAFYRFENELMHTLSFTLNNEDAAVQKMLSYVVPSFQSTDAGHTYRLREDTVSFIGNSSGFSWYSDTENGIVLYGNVLGGQAFFRIEKTGESVKGNDVRYERQSELFLLIANKRIWPELAAKEIEDRFIRYRGRFTLPGPSDQEGHYRILCSIERGEMEYTTQQVFEAASLKALFERELFFPEYVMDES